MLNRLIDFSLHNRLIVLLCTAALAVWGVYALIETPKDAIPDLSDTQVIVYTEAPEQAPQIVESQVTYPLTSALKSVPGAKVVRGYSLFGLSFIYIIFEDGTDPYWARSRVLEYLNYAAKRLPKGITPTLGPDATGVGWVYEYALIDRSGTHDLSQLRSLQDWYLRYELQSLPGVAEVASLGGFIKQYQIEVDPTRLAAYGIGIERIREAVARSNNDVGGRVIEMGESEFMVRGLGYIKSIADIENVVLSSGTRGVPVRVADVGRVVIGPDLRRGIAELDGEGEVVGAIIVMRSGKNAQAVIDAVKTRLTELKKGLPKGVEIVPVYDRSGLIDRAISTLNQKIIEEMLVVALVCVLFLLHLRSALVAVITLPLGILISFIVMHAQGINASIMSLGGIAIAIGAMVDAAIVMIENAHKHLERDRGARSHFAIISAAAKQVGPALFFSLLIITVSFLPIFTLEAQEGKLFAPLAYTKTYAMAGAALLSVTLVPVLMFYFIRGKIPPEHKNPLNRRAQEWYRPVLAKALVHQRATLVIAGIVMAITLLPFSRLGSEFMPALNEGDLLYMPTTFPEVSATKIKEVMQQTDRIIKTFPEVKTVFGKAGRADTATDPAPLMMLETTIQLKDRSEWRPGMTLDKLIAEMNRAVQFPGVSNTWTMPIKTRIDMLSTGIKSVLGVKISGPDLVTLERIAKQVEAVVRKVSGASNVFAERVSTGRYLDFAVDRVAASRYGLTVGDVQDVILSAVGGETITNTVEGLERYPVNVRYARELRDSPESLARVLVPLPGGGSVPLGQVSHMRITEGAASIRSENARPNAWVYVDVQDRDVGSVLKDAQRAVAEQVQMPTGYSIAWSGQYEYMQRVAKRMQLVIPLTLAIIFILLYINFRDAGRALLVMLSLPFALVGGVWLLWILDYQLSVAVAVGFVALAGVAAETGVIMLIYLDLAYREQRERLGAGFDRKALHVAVMQGAVERLRPKLMTVIAIMAGLLPIMWGSGAGSEVMRRIAAPMIGGMISSTLLTLVVIPVLYAAYIERQLRRERGTATA